MEQLKFDRSLLPLHLKKGREDASSSFKHLIPAAASVLEKHECSFCFWHCLGCSGIGEQLLFPSLDTQRARISLPLFWKRLSVQIEITMERQAWSWPHLSSSQSPWSMVASLLSCQEAQKACKLLRESQVSLQGKQPGCCQGQCAAQKSVN